MNYFSNLSKAFSVGLLATGLLAVATGTQPVLGAANVAAAAPGQRTLLPTGQQQQEPQMQIGQIYISEPDLWGMIGGLSTEKQVRATNYHTTDFSAFD